MGYEVTFSDRFQEFDSLVDLGRIRASQQKDKIAYSILKYGSGVDDQLTYEQLDRRARALAANLQGMKISGRNALLLFPAGLDFVVAFMGCLYAGVAAVPTPMPGRKDKDWIKTGVIAQDADVAAVLTVAAQADYVREAMNQDSFLKDVPCVEADVLDEALSERWVDPGLAQDDLAFLQYTSGSTGTPKGVMVTHGNLLHNEEMMRKAYQHTEDTVYVSWLPLFHDMGLIGNVLHTLYLGGRCYLMTPVAFLQQPLRWLQAISDYRASTSFAPNFAYELCLRRITEEQRDQLDLSCWTLALNGAEPVRADTLERFAEFFGPCGFKWASHYPAYGLAEATLFVSGTGRDEEPFISQVDSQQLQNHKIVYSDDSKGSQRLVSSGLTNTVQDVVIVNPDNFQRCSADEVGEVWIKGGSVAKGYWKKAEQTEETFHARIAEDGDGPYLRTGDLGFISDGRLFITGRLKDVVIVNGANFYPQDIELAVQDNQSVLRHGYGAVFGVDQDGSEQVVVVQEVERTQIKKINHEQVFRNIQQTVLQEFQIQVAAIVLIKPMTLPLTSSGKIQRRGTRKQFYESDLAEIASWFGSESLRREVKGEGAFDEPTSKPVGSMDVAVDSSAKAEAKIHWLRQYAETRINSALIDERRCVPPYIVMDFASQGLLGMCVPEQYSGQAMSVSESLRVIEQLAAIDANLAAMVSVHHVLGTRPILNYGSQLTKDAFLPKIAEGRILGALAITEPGAGSNPHAISATARPAPQGGWLITGEKCWIGNGSWSGVINTFVQVKDEQGNPKGLTAFAIEQGRSGMWMGEEAPTMGMRGMVQNRIHFKDVHVTETDMLGRIGQGMEIAQDAMMHGRLVIAAMSLGGLKRAAQLMTRYAQRRDVASGKLFESSVSIQRLSEMHATIAAVQAMVRSLAELIDQGVEIPSEIYAACKTSAPEFLWKGVDQLMQMLGGRGYTENNAVPQLMRDLRLFRIFEGPTEALNVFIGARVINGGEQILSFIKNTLQSSDVATDVASMASEMLHLATTSGERIGLNSFQVNQRAHTFVGDLATLHIVKAFVEFQNQRCPDKSLQQAKAWLNKCLEIKHAEVVASTGGSQVWMSAAQLEQAADDLLHDIGDIQQHAAGIERATDTLLLREGEPVKAPAAVTPPDLPVATPQEPCAAPESAVIANIATSEEEELETWMINWLSKRIRVSSSELSAQSTFVDVGLDSVSSVEFSFELERWLGFEVDSTVVWQYPSISVLTQFLLNEKRAKEAQQQEAEIHSNQPENLSTLSDDQVAAALACELE